MVQAYAALVLAGRRGPEDPLARSRGLSHRAFLEVGGVPMLLRVVRALRDAKHVGRIAISIDAPASLDAVPDLAAWRDAGDLTLHQSLGSPARSVADALAGMPASPVLVTTADHALLNGVRIDGFLARAAASDADVAVGVVERGAFRDETASAARTWLRLRCGHYTGANLFAFQNQRGHRAAEFFARAERHRKRPWRMLAAIGPTLGVEYLAGRLDLDTAARHISRSTGARVRPLCLEEAVAALDVDKPEDLALAERLLAEAGPA
jgi:GTP:adenosylcobinamide-phosphate guanylyltransferase